LLGAILARDETAAATAARRHVRRFEASVAAVI
jgi:DNA-binding GntR family transcriptional regulator